MAAPARVEFAVDMTCQSCAHAVEKALAGIEGVLSVEIDVPKESVIVSSTLPSARLKDLIETTGRRAVIKGLGATKTTDHLGAAVSIMNGDGGLQGVVRLLQAEQDLCIVDGTLDGLPPGQHGLFVHQLGDISNGCDSCGDEFEFPGSADKSKPIGGVGVITADASGRAEFRIQHSQLKVWDVIGRSTIVHQGNGENRLGCGIIARSAGMFENDKRICACDGVSIWDERTVPIAGEGRRILASL